MPRPPRWEPGEIVVHEHRVHLDKPVARGKHLLLTGIYQAETIHYLPVQGAEKVRQGDRVALTEIEVHLNDGQSR